MKVIELGIKVYLTSNITMEETMREIACLIDITLSNSEKYLEFHNKNMYKGYVFDGLYKIEQDGTYKEGKIYTFRIRTADEGLSDYFEKNLNVAYTKYIKVIAVSKRIIVKRHIEKIFTLTPVLLKSDQGYWKTHMSVEEYERRIRENLIKNYNFFTSQKIDESFELFSHFKFDNIKPILVPFKNNISLLGDKITLYISENEIAQDLAYFALAVGLGENSSRGWGFCGYKYLQ